MSGAINPFTGQRFPGDRCRRVHQPDRLALAALYPLPNRSAPLANYVSSPNLDDRNDQFDLGWTAMGGKLDLSAATASPTARSSSRLPGRLRRVPGYGNTLDRRGQNFVAGPQCPLAVSAERGAVRLHARRQQVNQEKQGTSINNQVGLPELSSNPRDWHLSFMTVTGFSPLGDETTTRREADQRVPVHRHATWSPARTCSSPASTFAPSSRTPFATCRRAAP